MVLTYKVQLRQMGLTSIEQISRDRVGSAFNVKDIPAFYEEVEKELATRCRNGHRVLLVGFNLNFLCFTNASKEVAEKEVKELFQLFSLSDLYANKFIIKPHELINNKETINELKEQYKKLETEKQSLLQKVELIKKEQQMNLQKQRQLGVYVD